MPGFLLQQLLSHVRGFFALVKIDPLANLAARVRGLDEAQPVPARRMAFLGQNFDHVAADDFMAQRHHLAVHLCAHALMADFRVHGIGKIDRRRAPGHLEHAPFGREGVDFDGRQIHFQRGKKFAGFLQLLRPLDELAHPGDALVVIARSGFAAFVFPVSRDTFFRDAVHFLCANLDFKRLAAMQNSGMKGLIKVWARHGDVIFETARNRTPDVVHHAESCVAISLRVRDDAHGEQVIHLLEAALLT